MCSQVNLISNLIKLGGREWKTDKHYRIYFNDIKKRYFELIKLEVGYYKTGNVSWATVNGNGISNSTAREILNSVIGKLYYDVRAGKFDTDYLDREIFDILVADIKQKLESKIDE
jgi:hypothetical protein